MTKPALTFPLLMSSCMAAAVAGVFLDLPLRAQATAVEASPDLGPPPWMTESGQAILAQAGAVRSPHAQHMGADHVEFSGKEANPHGHARFVSALPPGSPISCDKSEAANGYRVAELFEQRSLVRSATVRVRGVVTKVTTGILGQTYFHLRDGSGTLVNRDNDLTAVTSQTVELGQVLEVEGKVVLNRDLGFGYRYDLLLESVVVLSKV